MAGSSSDATLPMNTLLHLITIRLSSSNYLLWVNQMIPLLNYQHLLDHVDGSTAVPPSHLLVDEKKVENPDLAEWLAADQRAVILLQASLTEEAFSEVVGLTSARSIWSALESAYGNSSMERMQNLRDQLRLLSKGDSSVSEYGRKFKGICDQLAAIGHTVDESDKNHWFLCGLGASFQAFSIGVRTSRVTHTFRDLLAQAEAHELFMQSLHATSAPVVAFSAATASSGAAASSAAGRGRGGDSGGRNSGRGGHGRGRHEPHCQLCRQNGHYANTCPQLHTFASKSVPGEADLAKAFLANCRVNPPSPDWFVDSGASDHMVSSKASVNQPEPFFGDGSVHFGNGNTLPITSIGTSSLINGLCLRDVLVVPNLTKNLLSISKLTYDNNVDVVFSKYLCSIQDRATKQVLAQGKRDRGLYVISNKPEVRAFSATKHPKASFELWHSRLGHVSLDVISNLNKLGLLLVSSILPKPVICSPCQLAKSHRLPFDNNDQRASHVLDLIHCDLWGPSPVTSVDSYRYYVTFVDDFSRFTWLYPLKAKSDFVDVFEIFIAFVETQFSSKIKVFQTDGGTEFLNNRVKGLLHKHGIFHRISCPYTPQQNGRVERKHRHIVETGLAMMFHAHIPVAYWTHAFSSAVHIINRLPTKVLSLKSPFEVLFDRVPSYDNLRIFGCRVYPYLRDYSDQKLSPRSIPCVFIGYHSQYKGYLCLDPASSRIFVTRHARFDETSFPFRAQHTDAPIGSLPLHSFFDPLPADVPDSRVSPAPTPAASPVSAVPDPCPVCVEPAEPSVAAPVAEPSPEPDPTTTSSSSDEDEGAKSDSYSESGSDSEPESPQPGPPPSQPTTSSSSDNDEGAYSDSGSDSEPESPHPAPPPPAPTHPMTTRAKAGIFKPRYRTDLANFQSSGLLSQVFSDAVPKSHVDALRDTKWRDAMRVEMDALLHNQTWTLVPHPAHSNIVGCRWLFRTKYHADGTVDRHKARLVAQGFSQVPGLDFSHTFSPVVKAATVRTVLTLAITNGWHLRQLDVNNAFLHGHLGDIVYMHQPPGFADARHPDYVCKLNKALYGLRQAPRAWFHRLSSFLLEQGFTCSRSDPSLFVFRRDACILYLLVYVDDLIITGSDDSVVSRFIAKLHAEFRIKDLGRLNYFLGLEATHLPTGLFLSQAKYAHDIVCRAGLRDAKPMPTPLATNVSFVGAGTPFDDPTLYRSLVGALQYLTVTRPDISYAVNQVSQFLAAPTIDHFQAVKRLIRYVKGTLTFGLTFSRPASVKIVGYSDADWARCLDTRRSTYGYSIFLGGNLVSWSAKKQPTVSRSSCESEYRAMANTAAEIIWITHLLQELHALPAGRPTLLCDNQSALFLTQNPVAHKRAKHIDLDYHFVRELVASGKIVTMFVPTKLQVADIFTKSLPRPQFEQFRRMLRLGPPPIA